MSLRNHLKTFVLLGAMSGLIVAVGASLAPQQVSVFVALALLVNLGGYFFSDRIVLAMHHAREVDAYQAPTLHALVGELSHRAGIPRPRVFIIEDAQPNAFATGRNPRHGVVAVTTGILELLDRRELRGVLAHEIAHIKNRDILLSSLAAALAAVVTYVAQAASFGLLAGRSHDDEEAPSPAGGLLLALVAPLAATLVQLGISRSREFIADETGARLSGDPAALAQALQTLDRAAHLVPPASAQPATASLFIVSPFAAFADGVLRLFSTHPNTAERVRRLYAMTGGRTRWRTAA